MDVRRTDLPSRTYFPPRSSNTITSTWSRISGESSGSLSSRYGRTSRRAGSPWSRRHARSLRRRRRPRRPRPARRPWSPRWRRRPRRSRPKPAEREALPALLEEEPLLAQVRGFVQGVWGLFNQSQSEQDAKNRLAELKVRPEVRPGSAFAKSVVFLESRFPDMIAFLRHPTFVKRNSLAETGIRCLRRLEQGHDGFRGAAGLDRYLRLYQAIKYCRWTVYGLPREVPLLPTDTVDAVHSPDSPGLCQAG